MDKKKAEKARDLFETLEDLNKIKRNMEKEDRHWWSFLTHDIKSWYSDGLIMPEILCEEFTKAVDRSIEQLEKQIAEL